MKIYRRTIVSTAVLMSIAISSGCAVNPKSGSLDIDSDVKGEFNNNFNNPDPCADNNMAWGALGGGLVGALIGGVTEGGAKGAVVGFISGLAAGALIGHLVDLRECELSQIAKANNLEIESSKIYAPDLGITDTKKPDENLELGIIRIQKPHKNSTQKSLSPDVAGSDVQIKGDGRDFVKGTAQLTPESEIYLKKIATLYTPENQMATLPKDASDEEKKLISQRTLLIVGHTDPTEGVQGEALADLSNERAKAVAKVFAKAGVPANKINYQGAGDTQLKATSTQASSERKSNNRVQIVDVPNEKALEVYASKRTVAPAQLASPTSESPIAASREHELSKPKAAVGMDPLSGFDFGGEPLQTGYSIDLGAAPVKKSMWNPIATAVASDTTIVVGSCQGDKPRYSTEIKNLASGKTLAIREAVPGLFGQPWGGKHGNAFIYISHVYAPADATAPVPPATVLFYKDEEGKPKAKPSHVAANAPVNVYRGDKASLYRVFLEGAAQCLDLYVPIKSGKGEGTLFYLDRGQTYKAKSLYKSFN